MYQFYFEKLEVWKNSKELVKDIYQIGKKLPSEEQFNLKSQLQRAAISVPTNIAEGNSRSSLKEQARFLSISYGSLMELLNLLIISSDLGYISDKEFYALKKK